MSTVGAETPHRLRTDLLWAFGAALVATIVAAWKVGAPSALNGLWGHNDFTTAYASAATLERHLWVSPNSDFGFPFTQDLAHYPVPDVVHLMALKVLALVSGDALIATNLFLVLGFAAVAVSSYALFRVVRITPAVAFALAVSLSLVPWHFDRFIHVFLANYSSVALGLILVVGVLSWRLALSGPDRGRGRDLVILLVLGIYVGLSGGYYAAFVSILALSTLAFQFILGRRDRGLIVAAWLGLVPIIVTKVATLAYGFTAVTGAASATAYQRTPEESQLFGGAIFTLLRSAAPWSSGLPIPGLNQVTTVNSALEADARNSTVGLVAVIITLVVTGIILVRNGRTPGAGLVASLGYWPWLFMTSLLFFAVGGFGQAFALVFSFQIRSWGRFSIVAITIAYVILGLCLTYWLKGARTSQGDRWRQGLVVAVVLGVTAMDVVSMPPPFDRAAASAEADDLRAYGDRIDAAVPDGCGVYELPAHSFPEGVYDDGTATYDSMLPYLFAEHPRWSYGGIKGTVEGDWATAAVSRDTATLIAQTKAAGFCAIQLDAAAYSDGTSPSAALEASLGAPIATSTSGRWQLFSLENASPGPFTQSYALDPVTLDFAFGLEPAGTGGGEITVDLLGRAGTVLTRNSSGGDLTGTLVTEVRTEECAASQEVTLSSAADVVRATTTVEGTVTVELPLTAPTGGRGVAHVSTDGPCRVTLVNPRYIPD